MYSHVRDERRDESAAVALVDVPNVALYDVRDERRDESAAVALVAALYVAYVSPCPAGGAKRQGSR